MRKPLDREVYEFRKHFGKPLREYWNVLGFDVLKFDEEIAQSKHNQSCADAVLQTWGSEALNLIRGFLA